MAVASAQFWTDLKVNMTPDTLQVRLSSTINTYGERTFTGGATTYECYLRRSNAADRNLTNDYDDVEWVAYIMDPSLTLAVDDQITLPTPVSGTRPIRRVDTKKDQLGQVAVIAYIGGR